MKKAVAAVAALVLCAWLGVRFGGAWAARRALARRGMEAARASSYVGKLVLDDVRMGEARRARQIVIDYDLLPLLLLRVHADLRIYGARVALHPEDRHAAAPGERRGRVRIRSVTVRGGAIGYDDPALGLSARAGVDASWRPGEPLRATLDHVHAGLAAGLRAWADRVELARAPGAELPRVEIHGGRARLWAGLDLTDITGWIAPHADGALDLALAGSWGGAGGRIWDASGFARPATGEAEVRVRADRFRLDRLAPVLAGLPLAKLDRAEIGGDLVVRRADGAVEFQGSLALSGLTLEGPRIAATPVANLGGEASVRGRFDPKARTLAVEEALVHFGRLTLLLNARAERLGDGPIVRAHLRVPPVACQAVLDSLPPALVPKLAGLLLAGFFEADVSARIDFGAVQRLRADGSWRRNRRALTGPVELRGRVGLAGCRVVQAPADMPAGSLLGTFAHTAEITPGHFASFAIGPENPDYAPLAEISPHLVAAILTTEDSRFFDHHGFVVPEIRTAMARNLVERRFAYGASSITMQMVKNVLLARDKTLARKLQEAVLTWYVEQALPKERILEIYLNAIEFGPGIFGIGRAARHYFGRRAADLTPLESAFFSSILPSPKRRYEHYCRGRLSPRWEKYLPRILKRMHERGRLTDAEYAEGLAGTLAFDRTEAKPEKECLDLVRRIAGATPDEPLDEIELPFVEPDEEPDEEEPPDDPAFDRPQLMRP